MQIISFDEDPIKLTRKLKRDILRPYIRILKMSRNEDTPNVGRFKKELRAIGTEIWNILGSIFKRYDLDVKEGTSLAIALDDETVDIPWELALFKKRPRIHLCENMNIGRLRVVKSEVWENPPPERRRKPRALVVGIDYKDKDCRKELGELDWAEKEAEEVASILEGNGFSVTLLLGRNAKRKRIVKGLRRGVDVFHFTGHGRMIRDESKIMACDEDLLAKNLVDILDSAVAPSLSFMNACETAIERDTVGQGLWEVYSWAYALAEQGGKVFVGTLWPIFEDAARWFSRRFYEEILGLKKRTLAEAIRQAKLDVKKRAKDETIYTWPAYVLYGPPSLLIDDLLH